MFIYLRNKKVKVGYLRRGFIALVATMIISSFLLGLVFANNASSFLLMGSSNINEHKLVSLSDAESCLNLAKFRISRDYNYSGNEAFDLGERFCVIKPISYEIDIAKGKKIATVNVQGRYSNSISNLKVLLEVDDPNLIAGKGQKISIISRLEF